MRWRHIHVHLRDIAHVSCLSLRAGPTWAPCGESESELRNPATLNLDTYIDKDPSVEFPLTVDSFAVLIEFFF